MSDRRDVQISKSLSYLLRHGALKERLPIDKNGYIPIGEVLKHNRLKTHKCSVEDIHRIVGENDKKRFHIKKETLQNGLTQEFICATQGHSINTITPDREVLEEIRSRSELPDKLVHGTSISNAVLILQSGFIKKMARNHVHLAPGVTGLDSQVISGMRYSSNVHIYLKTTQELLDKIQLYKSLNDVYLTPDDVELSLFEKITIKPPKNSNQLSSDFQALIRELDRQGTAYEVVSRQPLK